MTHDICGKSLTTTVAGADSLPPSHKTILDEMGFCWERTKAKGYKGDNQSDTDSDNDTDADTDKDGNMSDSETDSHSDSETNSDNSDLDLAMPLLEEVKKEIVPQL